MRKQVTNNKSSEKKKELIQRIIQNNRGSHNPELQIVEDFKQDIEQRMDNVAVFYPLAEILQRRDVDDANLQLVPELCFLFSTYLIYIGKSNFKGVSFSELTYFVKQKVIPTLGIPISDDDEIKVLTDATLEALQNNGHNYSFSTLRLGCHEIHQAC